MAKAIFIKAKRFFKNNPDLLPKRIPKSRKFKAKFSIYGDGRGLALAGLGAIGVGEGIRRARSQPQRKRKKR